MRGELAGVKLMKDGGELARVAGRISIGASQRHRTVSRMFKNPGGLPTGIRTSQWVADDGLDTETG